jgi:hypothetical protein
MILRHEKQIFLVLKIKSEKTAITAVLSGFTFEKDVNNIDCTDTSDTFQLIC